MEEQYGVPVLAVNVAQLKAEDIRNILEKILYRFPLKELRFYCPGWVETLEDDHWLKQEMIEALKKLMTQTERLEDVEPALTGLSEAEHLKNAHTEHMLPGEGAADIGLNFCDGLFYEILSETVDLPIENDYSLVETIKLLSQVKKEYDIRRQADKEEREELLKLRREPDITKDGREIEIYANIGNMDDLNSVLYYGAAGIGLLRSEFQYLGRENYPRENELFLAYKKIAETMGEKLTVIRTADLGADKQAEYLNIPDETNPIMGNRGIRLCLDRKRMFKAQLRAIFRASAYGNLALMYPMISSEEEMDEIEEIIREVKIGLDEKGIPYKHIKTGIMIETPAAVMISRELARRVDFLSLGTNDLSQYTLAMDRQNPLLRKKYNDHHPAVLRMIQMVIEAGHAENRRVCICGELAADTALTEEFLRMGVDCLSVVPACILPVRKALRQVDLSGDDKGA